jgi:hypothetical protein
MADISLPISKELLDALGDSVDAHERFILQAVALEAHRLGKVGTRRAGAAIGLGQIAFLKLQQEHEVPSHTTREELVDGYHAAKKFMVSKFHYILADMDVLWKFSAAETDSACKSHLKLLPELFRAPLYAAKADVLREFDGYATTQFTGKPWLILQAPSLDNAQTDQLQIVTLMAEMARKPAEVLVISDDRAVRDAVECLPGELRARLSVAPFEAIIAHAAEQRLIPSLEDEIAALKAAGIHTSSRGAETKLRELARHLFKEFCKQTGLSPEALWEAQAAQDGIPSIQSEKEREVLSKFDSMKATQSISYGMSDDDLMELAREFVENGLDAANQYDIDTAKNLAAQRGGSWKDIYFERREAESAAENQLAVEIAKRTGRKVGDVSWELSMADAKRKAKISRPD